MGAMVSCCLFRWHVLLLVLYLGEVGGHGVGGFMSVDTSFFVPKELFLYSFFSDSLIKLITFFFFKKKKQNS
jgi:hypothetical protein